MHAGKHNVAVLVGFNEAVERLKFELVVLDALANRVEVEADWRLANRHQKGYLAHLLHKVGDLRRSGLVRVAQLKCVLDLLGHVSRKLFPKARLQYFAPV